jgi:hypothetical protein
MYDVRPGQKFLLEVKDVQLSYATKDIYGAVTDGYLDLKGHMAPVHLSWDQGMGNRVKGTMEATISLSSGPPPGSFIFLYDCSNSTEVGTLWSEHSAMESIQSVSGKLQGLCTEHILCTATYYNSADIWGPTAWKRDQEWGSCVSG